jgi:hypothetical protein
LPTSTVVQKPHKPRNMKNIEDTSDGDADMVVEKMTSIKSKN